MPHDAPESITRSFTIPMVATPQGGGAVLIRPGRPIQRLSPKEFAAQVGLSRSSVYRYIGSDALPERFVVFAGRQKLLIAAEAVPHFLEYFAAHRGAAGLPQKGS